MSQSDYTEHIARISYGKDSLKMLDVIISRGLPLDRITTTDVWATDTVPAWLPPMQQFRERMDERIWWKYRMEVEHLCARNKDGSKRTYEQMFYHVPVRRSQTCQVERERETGAARIDPRIPGSVEPLVSSWPQTEFPNTECRERLPDSLPTPGTTTARNSKFVGQAIKGFPLSRRGNGGKWCQDLKTQAARCFLPSATRGAGKQISWNT